MIRRSILSSEQRVELALCFVDWECSFEKLKQIITSDANVKSGVHRLECDAILTALACRQLAVRRLVCYFLFGYTPGPTHTLDDNGAFIAASGCNASEMQQRTALEHLGNEIKLFLLLDDYSASASTPVSVSGFRVYIKDAVFQA